MGESGNSQQPPVKTTRTDRSYALGLAVVFFAGLLGMAGTWLCWPDALIDAGRELYVAWRLSLGDVLYRDVLVFNGPLSPYVNAAWFKLVGVGVHQLMWLNAVILAGTLALLYSIAHRIGGAWGATLGGLAAVGLFVFGQVIPNDSSSFMLPYSHEITHGVFLLLAMLCCLGRFDSTRRHAWLAAAAFSLGLAFLTKVEIFVAGAAALAVALAGIALLERASLALNARRAAIVLAMLALPALVAWALLSLAMPADTAWRGVLGSWAHLGNTQLTSLPYFKIWMGTQSLTKPGESDIAGSLCTILGWTAWYAVIGLCALVLGQGMSDQRKRPALAIFGAVGLLLIAGVSLAGKSAGPVAYVWPGAAGLSAAGFPGWLDAGRPMPVLMLVTIVAASITTIRMLRLQRLGPTLERDAFIRREIFVLASAVLALALMAKMILMARSWHYGFALGLPAGAIAFAGAGGAVPNILERYNLAGGRRSAIALRAVVAATLLGIIAVQWRTAVLPIVESKAAWIGSGTDRFRVNQRGKVLAEVVTGLASKTPSSTTIAVLPEGAIVNYLLRRANPTPYAFLLPSDLLMFNEQKVAASFSQHPPDLIVLVDRNTIEYGAQSFGADYAQGLWEWITNHYDFFASVGNPPFKGKGFGVIVVKRKI